MTLVDICIKTFGTNEKNQSLAFRLKSWNEKKTDTVESIFGGKNIRPKKWYYVLSIREKCLLKGEHERAHLQEEWPCPHH